MAGRRGYESSTILARRSFKKSKKRVAGRLMRMPIHGRWRVGDNPISVIRGRDGGSGVDILMLLVSVECLQVDGSWKKSIVATQYVELTGYSRNLVRAEMEKLRDEGNHIVRGLCAD